MRDARLPGHPSRHPSPGPAIPRAQARALDRRRRLDEQQRSFRGPHAGPSADPIPMSDRFAVNGPAGPGPA